MDGSPEQRSKRQRRDASYKMKAMEKFKQIRSGIKNKYEVDELENVYETVDENVYVKEVLSRQDDDWIVDDDGSGYVEDGRDIFDDDLDMNSIAEASKGKGLKRKKKAVSDPNNKANLQYMLSNMKPKKKEEVKKVDDDDLLAELLNEDSESSTSSSIKPKPLNNSFSRSATKKAADNYMKSLSNNPKPTTMVQKRPTPLKKDDEDVIVDTLLKDEIKEKVSVKSIDKEKSIVEENENKVVIKQEPKIEESMDETCADDFPDDDFDTTIGNETLHTTVEESDVTMCQAIDEEDWDDDVKFNDITSEWEATQQNIENIAESQMNVDASNVHLLNVDDKKVFRFFWWDAYEDPNQSKGVIYMFGKTYDEKTKSYLSCCVVVRNIEKVLHILPKPFELDNNGKPTDQPVSQKTLFNEIRSLTNLSSFKSRFVKKKFFFDPQVPKESDYMELRYLAKDGEIHIDPSQSKYIEKVFGTNTSYTETFLLEKKIKGPCWIDIANPIVVNNPGSWAKIEINCNSLKDLSLTQLSKPLPPPPLVTATINIRTALNPKNNNLELVMISCITHFSYSVDKPPPNPPFQQHFCIFRCPTGQILPKDLYAMLANYKATKAFKVDSENALMNLFIAKFSQIDPDLMVGHDLLDFQMNVLFQRCNSLKLGPKKMSQLGKIKRTIIKNWKTLFLGRLVCDIKMSARELIKVRTYDLDTLCVEILKLKEGQREELEPDEVPKMFQSTEDIKRLISHTMQDTSYILRIMYDLNAIPLALQITNIAGNTMAKTLTGGRSERNEYLLLHAFAEQGHIVPDKVYGKKVQSKKGTYAGGLVLEPKVGLYDTFILLMDFNSLYPSIIQEYNICFTTMPENLTEDNMVLPDSSLPVGILPTEIRKLVESRREVKKLMSNPDLLPELRMQYNIRQMALKLTANSMYGCLGFSHSRFYAKNLAALITYKGREILTNTQEMVQKMCYEVIYGDTDSIMINTNCSEYDQVMKIGNKIKQEVNKLYKKVELDIDGVFKYMLLLKKKKYAAVTLAKTKSGELKSTMEFKGLDIVRRDWSQLASETGKYILTQILSDQSSDDRLNNIQSYLMKIKEDLKRNKVPLPLLVITKQLTKRIDLYTDKQSLPHVQVAIRYNSSFGGHLGPGDAVPYVICDDGTQNPATQRAFHIDELKNSKTLKIDVDYYLEMQIFPVVSRIIEPVDGIDLYQVAEWLDLKNISIKKAVHEHKYDNSENQTQPEIKFRACEKFAFNCLHCKKENVVSEAISNNTPFLIKCSNLECKARPIDYIYNIQYQLVLSIRKFIDKYYEGVFICEDPSCPNETKCMPLIFEKNSRFPSCSKCRSALMYESYSCYNLFNQLQYFRFMFDIAKVAKKPLMEANVEAGYHMLRATVDNYLNRSKVAYANLTELFAPFTVNDNNPKSSNT